jgi:hypothetical protein
MNLLASSKLVDDTVSSFADATPGTDIEVHPAQIVQSELAEAEFWLDSRKVAKAEDALNRAAALFRTLGVPNTSRRYRILSRRAAYARVGEIPTDEEEPTLPFGQIYTK